MALEARDLLPQSAAWTRLPAPFADGYWPAMPAGMGRGRLDSREKDLLHEDLATQRSVDWMITSAMAGPDSALLHTNYLWAQRAARGVKR